MNVQCSVKMFMFHVYTMNEEFFRVLQQHGSREAGHGQAMTQFLIEGGGLVQGVSKLIMIFFVT